MIRALLTGTLDGNPQTRTGSPRVPKRYLAPMRYRIKPQRCRRHTR